MASGNAADPPAPARRFPRPLRWLAALLLALVALAVIGALVLDSPAGRRFIIDRVERLAPESGLRIRIGRIDGSIYGAAVVRDLRLLDTKGEFLRVPEARIDWRPFDFLLANELDIRSLIVPRARLARLPELVPSLEDQPILPDFDIHVGRLDVARLQLGAAIAGRPHVARLAGRADIRSGMADVDLDARLLDGDDRVVLDMRIAPDAGDFDIDADVVAPTGGVLATMAGLDRGLTGTIRGQGDWDRWSGSLLADSVGPTGTAALARLRLGARDGRYTATGRVAPALVLSNGLVDRLSEGGLAVDVDGTFAERRWEGRIALVGSALQLDTEGGIDLAANRFNALRADLWLRRPGLLLETMDGQNARVALRLDGAFAGPRFEYRATAPWLLFGTTRLEGIEARGSGIAGRDIAQIPVALSVDRVRGLGALAEGIVRNLRAEGVLQLRDNVLTSDLIRLRSAGLNGRLAVLANFTTGDYLVGFDGALPGLEIAGLGRIDLLTDLEVRRRPGGALGIGGTARATVRRLDNGFLRTLTGGLPVVSSALSVGPDGVVRFTNLRVTSPLLTLSGEGVRRADGTFQLSGRGVHRNYGPAVVTLDGPIDRPLVNLRLASPVPAAGLSDVLLRLMPDANGFQFEASGGSTLGPFTASGAILLPRGGSAIVDIRRLAVGGTVASGRLAVVTGGLAGSLRIAGGGVNGSVVLSVTQGVQRIVADLTARDARFAGPPPITLRRAQLQATILLDPRGTDIDATIEGAGLQRGGLSLARFAGNARIVGGRGTVRASVGGYRGRAFTFSTVIGVTPDRYRVSGSGTLGRRRISLSRPAVVRRTADGWALDAAELSVGRGRLRLSGTLDDALLSVDAALENMPLALLEIANPDLLFGGTASGRLSWRDGAGPPTGTAELRLRNFTRTGLTGTGAPLDIGVNAALTADSAAMRAVVAQNGATIGRIQARMAPLGGGSDLVARLTNAPLTARLTYDGEIGPLWQLARIDAFALSGPVAVNAQAQGSLANPQIRGTLRAHGARFESFNTGTVVTDVSAIGRFDGSRLQLRNVTGATAGGGAVTGEGDFDLAAANGFGMDLRLRATNALLIERDDLSARVTGPVRLLSDGNGGTISGNLVLNSGRFRLGRATAAEALPVINVVEVNLPADRAPRRAATSAPWQLNVAVRGRNGFIVTGLGLESEWRTDVRVRGPVNDFSIVGTANLVRGDYNFAGRRFELREGAIRFTGDAADPVLDIEAVDDISGIDATIRIGGTGSRPEISFSSVPALPEDELLSRILFGSSVTDISVTEAAQLGIALASLRSGGDGLDPINAIRRATGLDRLRILPANSEIGAGTSIAAGKYLTRRVYVEVITDGQGYSATRVEYQVTRWLSVLAAISTLNDESINLRVEHDY